MRRRRRGRLESEQEIVAAYAEALEAVNRWYPDRLDPRRPDALRRLLDEAGTDVVEVFRARLALRRSGV